MLFPISLADQLFGFNINDDPAAIEIAFVDFSHRVRNEMTKDTIYSGVVNGSGYTQFKNLVGSLNTNGGTNYDTAIEAANSVLWNDADPVYVIFITDGDTVSRGYLAYDGTGATDHAADWMAAHTITEIQVKQLNNIMPAQEVPQKYS